MSYGTDAFLAEIYRRKLQNIESLSRCGENRLKSLMDEKRARLREALGLRQLEEMAEEPRFELVETIPREGYAIHKYDATVLPGLTGPLFAVLPENPNGKAVIYCHGHGCGVEDALDIDGVKDAYHKTFPLSLAKRGYAAFTMEYAGFGRLTAENRQDEENRGCFANHTAMSMCGLSLIGLRVFQTLKEIGFVMGELGYTRAALSGISGGGMVCACASPLAENLAGTCIFGYTCTFKASTLSVPHCVCNFVPDLLSVGEEPEIIALAAPRPLLVVSGDQDPIFPIAAVKEAVEYIRSVYGRFGADGGVKTDLFSGGHEIHEDAVYDWLEEIM